jgi:MFS family permease
MVCGFNLWVRDLVPEARRGRLTGARLAAMAAISIVLGLGAGAFIDLWKANDIGPATMAYSILFIGAFIGGTYSTWCMTRMPEPRMAPPEAEVALVERLGHPWSDQNYRRLLLFLGVWNFAVNLAAPFFLVHMLQRLHLDLWIVMALTLTSQFFNVLVLRRWGEIADRMSNKSVLRVCAPLFVACIFAWTFTTFPEPHTFTIPLLVVIHMLTGISTAGVALASGNIAMKLAPPGDATAYLANNSLVISIASGVAPIVGGLVANFFTQRALSLSLNWSDPDGSIAINTLSISQWDFFFVLAAIIGLIAVSMLRRVRETGEVEESLVLNEMYLQARRFVQNLSSIAGLRQAEEIPFGRFEILSRKDRRPAPHPEKAD